MAEKRVAVMTGAVVTVTVFLTTLAPVVGVYADSRDALREQVGGGRSVGTTPPPPPSPSPLPPVPEPSGASGGGITNVTIGEVNSGGNSGGNVTTGDESVDVQVTNVGPVNSNTTETVDTGGQGDVPPEPEEPQCETDARGRTICPVDSTRSRG